jgi:hypothetical protein
LDSNGRINSVEKNDPSNSGCPVKPKLSTAFKQSGYQTKMRTAILLESQALKTG